MVTSLDNEDRRRKILNHIGRYTFSLVPVIQKLYFNGKRCDSVLGTMIENDLIVARPDAEEGRKGTLIPGGYKYYQLTRKAAKQLGVPSSRTKPPAPGSFDKHLAILWYCCMGKRRLNVLEQRNIHTLFAAEDDLFVQAPEGPYCIELEGDHRVFRVIVPGLTARESYHINQFKQHLDTAMSHPVLTRWIQARRLAYAFLVSNDGQRKTLHSQLKNQGYFGTVHCEVVTVPTHQTLDTLIGSKPKPVKKKQCSKTKLSANH